MSEENVIIHGRTEDEYLMNIGKYKGENLNIYLNMILLMV